MNPTIQKAGEAVKGLFSRVTMREWVVLFALAVFAIAFFVERGKPRPEPATQAQTDSTEIKKLIGDYNTILSEKRTLLETILRLKSEAKPTGGAAWKPPTSPLAHDTVFVIQPPQAAGDSVKPPAYQVHLYREDMVFAVFAQGGIITIATINPYYQTFGQPYVKSYEFQREGRDFQFAVTEPSGPLALDGVKLNYVRRLASFEGVWIGGGAMFPRQFYGSMAVVFEFYERLQVVPMATTLPAVGIEVRYKLFE